MERLIKRFKKWISRIYHRSMGPRTSSRTKEITSVLKEVSLFSEFSRSEIHNFAESLHVRSYKKDEYLYKERDPGLGLYIVQSGRIRLLVEDEEGALHEVKHVSENGVIGELALLGDYRRLETAQAAIETTVLGFFRPELKSMIKRDPKTAALLLSSLSELVSDHYVQLITHLIEKDGKISVSRMIESSRSQPVQQHDASSFIFRS